MDVAPTPNFREARLTPEAVRQLAAEAPLLLRCSCGRCVGFACSVRWPWAWFLVGTWGHA